MKRFHISSDGLARRCQAQSAERCTAKGLDGEKAEHGSFESLMEAQKWAERVVEESSGAVLKGESKVKVSTSEDQMNSDLLAPITIPLGNENDGVSDNSISDAIEEAFSSPYGSAYAEPLPPSVREFSNSVYAGEIPEFLPFEMSEHYALHRGGINIMMLRSALQKRGYYAHVTQVFAKEVSEIEGIGTVLDPLAGSGFLAKSLREQGVPTVMTDDYSWGFKGAAENLDALAALEKYGDKVDTVVISWAPYNSDIDKKLWDRARERFPHLNFLVISEGVGGCTGSESFAEIHEQFEELQTYSTSYGIRDRAVFYRSGDFYVEPDPEDELSWSALGDDLRLEAESASDYTSEH